MLRIGLQSKLSIGGIEYVELEEYFASRYKHRDRSPGIRKIGRRGNRGAAAGKTRNRLWQPGELHSSARNDRLWWTWNGCRWVLCGPGRHPDACSRRPVPGPVGSG